MTLLSLLSLSAIMEHVKGTLRLLSYVGVFYFNLTQQEGK